MVLLAALLQGCAAIGVGYEADTRVWPSDSAGEYIVAFDIYESLIAGGSRLVSSPRLKVRDGCQGEVTLGDEHSSLKCSALVTSSTNGTKAAIRVRIKTGDRKEWTARQTVAVFPTASGGANAPAECPVDGESERGR
jgi:hypothetical protein